MTEEATQRSKGKYILKELVYHLPFSIFGVMLAMLAMGVLSSLAIIVNAPANVPVASSELFHIFHPAHILLSAVASTAMFWMHDKKLIKALAVGIIGSIVICGVSDILLPFVGGRILGMDMHLHICLIESPGLILPFSVIGTLAGLAAPMSFEKATEYSHSMHVFVSSSASILYLIGYGLTDWMHAAGAVFMITVVAVMIPCCLSDIAFPLACSHTDCHHPDILDDHSS